MRGVETEMDDDTHTLWMADISTDESVGFLMLAEMWQHLTGRDV